MSPARPSPPPDDEVPPDPGSTGAGSTGAGAASGSRGAEALQGALQELIDVGRAVLDVAEELVRDPAAGAAVADAVRSVADAVGRNGGKVVDDLRRAAARQAGAARSRAGGEGGEDGPEGSRDGPDDDGPDGPPGGFHRIRVG